MVTCSVSECDVTRRYNPNHYTFHSHVRRSQDILYMRMLRFGLRIINAWPRKILGEFYPNYVSYIEYHSVFFEVTCFPLQILFLINNVGILNFSELGHAYITILLNGFAAFRVVSAHMNIYKSIVGDFICNIHLFHHKERSQYAMKIHISVHKLCFFYTLEIQVMTVLALILFNAEPLYQNVSSGSFDAMASNVTYEHAVYYALPFDYLHNIKGYIVVSLFNWYISINVATGICIMDLLMCIMIFHLWGHLRILIHNMDNFRRPMSTSVRNQSEYFSDEELVLVSQDLKDIILHHRLITEFTRRISTVFGPILLISYFFHLVSGCVLLLKCADLEPDVLARYGTLTFMAFQEMIQISVIFELLSTTSEKLSNSVYGMPWECMDAANRKTVTIILIQTQRSLAVKASDMVDVGVQTMAAIIKTTLSYFIMLRTVAESNQ